MIEFTRLCFRIFLGLLDAHSQSICLCPTRTLGLVVNFWTRRERITNGCLAIAIKFVRYLFRVCGKYQGNRCKIGQGRFRRNHSELMVYPLKAE
jgi:hypothetical protein